MAAHIAFESGSLVCPFTTTSNHFQLQFNYHRIHFQIQYTLLAVWTYELCYTLPPLYDERHMPVTTVYLAIRRVCLYVSPIAYSIKADRPLTRDMLNAP